MPACSQANIVPVRPKPTAISSAIRCTPNSSQAWRSSFRYAGWYMRMPPAHCTSGSTITAAASCAWRSSSSRMGSNWRQE